MTTGVSLSFALNTLQLRTSMFVNVLKEFGLLLSDAQWGVLTMVRGGLAQPITVF